MLYQIRIYFVIIKNMATKKYTKDEIVEFLISWKKKSHKKERTVSGDLWTDQYNIALDDIILKIINDL